MSNKSIQNIYPEGIENIADDELERDNLEKNGTVEKKIEELEIT